MKTLITMLAAGAVLCAGAAKRVPDEVKARETAHYSGTGGSAKPAKRVPDEVAARESAAARSGTDVWVAGAGLTPVGIDIMREMVNELWADYTNRMERARIRKERMDAARIRNGENVNGRPPVAPWRADVKPKRVPARKGGAK